jgi:hypothetical protein
MSNHLVNANKMVSDTPISDSTPHNVAELGMLCRRLERELNAANKTNRLQYELITTAEKRGVDKSKEELNAANERIKLLEAVTNDPHALWANWLRGSVALPVGIGDVRQYQDRIKRLEAAGDEAIYPFEYAARVRIWTEAKEAKL